MKPIVDIQVTKTNKCPQGYDNLILRNFGTSIGCECYDAFSNTTNIYVGNCDINQTSFGCERIAPVGPTALTKIFSYKVCGLREGPNFLDMERPVKVRDTLQCSGSK